MNACANKQLLTAAPWKPQEWVLCENGREFKAIMETSREVVFFKENPPYPGKTSG